MVQKIKFPVYVFVGIVCCYFFVANEFRAKFVRVRSEMNAYNFNPSKSAPNGYDFSPVKGELGGLNSDPLIKGEERGTYFKGATSNGFKKINSQHKSLPEKSIRVPNKIKNPGKPVILMWNTGISRKAGPKDFSKLKIPEICGSCEITDDRSRVGASDAVVIFHNNRDLTNLNLPDPGTRNPDQFYVFRTKETPAKSFRLHEVLKHPQLDGIFNLTWYFRRDADVRHDFGFVESALYFSRQDEKLNNLTRLIENKKGLAVWAVSNCENTYGATQRLNYGMELMKNGLNVTAIGKCFGGSTRQKHKKVIEDFKDYKFYLAFENSIHCPDYITEKFWRNGIGEGLVPVVFGPTRADVEAVAPHNSFIHTDDFNSTKDLVNYLNYLDKNDTAYLQYHQWRKTKRKLNYSDEYLELTFEMQEFCQLCDKLTEKPIKRKVVGSIHDWMYKSKKYVDDFCLYGRKK